MASTGEAHERLLEAEDIMIKAWTTENFEHRGKFWSLRLPLLRPRPYTVPHPRIIRACSSEEAMLGMARAGRPFLMNVQTNEVTRHRMDRYRATMRESGFDEATVARNVADTWVWRNVFVARRRRGERLARPLFEPRRSSPVHAQAVYEEQGVLLKPETEPRRATSRSTRPVARPPPWRGDIQDRRDRRRRADLAFRIGPMPGEVAEQSIRLFMQQVAPEFRSNVA